MISPLNLAIICPILGMVVAIIFDLVPMLRKYSKYVGALACGLTFIMVSVSQRVTSEIQVLSLWQPAVLLGSVLAVQADGLVRPLAMILVGVTFSAFLATAGRNTSHSPRLRNAVLGSTATGILALFSANVLSMLIGWTAYDVFTAIGRISSGRSVHDALRGLVSGCISTILLWAGGLQGGTGLDLGLWSLMEPEAWQLLLWTMAVVIRLGLYPLSFSVPNAMVGPGPLDVPFLMNGAIGWGLWIRILSIDKGSIPQFEWLNILAVTTLGLGSLLAWSCPRSSRMLAWLPMGGRGAVLLAACLTPRYAITIVSTGSSALLLGTALIALGGGVRLKHWWWSIPPVTGGVVLAMLPITLGFATTAFLLDGVLQQARTWWGLAFFVHQILLIPSVTRLLRITPYPLPANHGALGVWGAGLAIPALAVLIIGLQPSLLAGAGQVPSWGKILALPGLTGWLLWLVAAAIGGILAWQDTRIRGRLELWLSAVHDLLRLDWLYRAVTAAADRGLSLLRITDETITGTGALFWSILLVLILVLTQGI